MKPKKPRTTQKQTIIPYTNLIHDNTEAYQIDDILDDRWRRGRAEYLVRWTGYTPADDQWVTEQALVNAPELIRWYREKTANRPHNARHATYRRRKRDTLS
jgi:hypothetical protein